MPRIVDLFEKANFLLLKYVSCSLQSTLSYLYSYSIVLWVLEHVFVAAYAVFSKEKKRRHIFVSTSPSVVAVTLFSLTVTLCHRSLGSTLKHDQSPLWPLDYTCNSLYKTVSLRDLNAVPHRREAISTLIYSPSFTVELY